eukprot:Colp12_sorted_trinity150504_noHs@21939
MRGKSQSLGRKHPLKMEHPLPKLFSVVSVSQVPYLRRSQTQRAPCHLPLNQVSLAWVDKGVGVISVEKDEASGKKLLRMRKGAGGLGEVMVNVHAHTVKASLDGKKLVCLMPGSDGKPAKKLFTVKTPELA